MEIVEKTDAQWREELTPEQYQVLRKAGTERAFTGKYWDNHEDGVFRCAGCGAELFSSDTKFESGSGWPSFTEPAVAENVETKRDISHGMIRTEVVCKKCGGHLGHVFEDGPRDAADCATASTPPRSTSALRVGVSEPADRSSRSSRRRASRSASARGVALEVGDARG